MGDLQDTISAFHKKRTAELQQLLGLFLLPKGNKVIMGVLKILADWSERNQFVSECSHSLKHHYLFICEDLPVVGVAPVTMSQMFKVLASSVGNIEIALIIWWSWWSVLEWKTETLLCIAFYLALGGWHFLHMHLFMLDVMSQVISFNQFSSVFPMLW